jgi:tetratricopeptide (TPR) repeat protein
MSAKFGEIDAIAAEKGIAAANEVITALYRAIRRASPRGTKICHTSPGEYVFVLDADGLTRESALEVARKIQGEAIGLGRVGIGVYAPRDFPVKEINGARALELAQFARPPGGDIQFFDASTPGKVLYQWRTDGLFDEALADYKRFREYGFEDAFLENQAGLCLLEKKEPDYQGAVTHLQRALEIEPSDEVFRGNLAIALARGGRLTEALEMFRPILRSLLLPSTHSDFLGNVYLVEAVVVMAKLGYEPETGDDGLSQEEVRQLVDRAIKEGGGEVAEDGFVALHRYSSKLAEKSAG